MKKIKYVIYKEGKYYVSQCLNVDVSSFGVTIDEASSNLKEALQLYFKDDNNKGLLKIGVWTESDITAMEEASKKFNQWTIQNF